MRSLKSFSLHLLLFILIEIVFVFILFREIPQTGLFTLIGIAHLSYWVVLIIAGLGRQYAKTVIQRFLATYIPVVYHLGIHLWIGVETIHAYDGPEYAHYETIWLIVAVAIVGVLIYRGETLLHRKYHCDAHHHQTHKHCCEDGHDECETKHS